MKKFISLILALVLAASLIACGKRPASAPETNNITPTGSESGTTQSTAPTDDSSATYDAHISAVSLPLSVETKYAEDKNILFTYSYQNVSVTLPDQDVATIVELDLMNKIDSTRSAAEKIYQASVKAYTKPDNWYPYFYRISYDVMRLDQNILSLFGNESSFDGNLRATSADICRTYDLTTGEILTLRDVLYNDYSADALCELIINALSHYDENELFFDYKETVQDKFSTNVPVETWYFTEKGLCFFFAPYELASFAMGTITAEIPYSELSGLMKAEYFPEEKLIYSGTLKMEDISQDATPDLSRFSQFGEIELHPETNKYLLSTDGSILNLRVYIQESTSNYDNSTTMIYATAGMGPKDAVILDIPESMLDKVSVSFESNGEIVTIQLSDIAP